MDNFSASLLLSGSSIEFRPVHHHVVQFDNTGGNLSDFITFLTNTQDGKLDEIPALLDAFGADVFVLQSGLNSSASFGSVVGVDDPDQAWVITSDRASATLVRHELGHVFGNGDVPGDGKGYEEYSYGHIFMDSLGRQRKTIMRPPTDPGTGIDLFSSPEVYYDGVATGVDGSRDVARTIEATKRTIEQHRAPVVQLSAATHLISRGLAGLAGNADARSCSLSADGNLVAFSSRASNLVDGDSNGVADVFVLDRAQGQLQRISVGHAGEQGNGPSGAPTFCSDGRWVAFHSRASNLVPGDRNRALDVFVYDRLHGTQTRISLADDGSEADGPSSFPSISADGQRVAFSSAASNLLGQGVDQNGVDDVFLRDGFLQTTQRVSVDASGQAGNARSAGAAISADGWHVAFHSDSQLDGDDQNLSSDVYVRDVAQGGTAMISKSAFFGGWRAYDAPSLDPTISADGRFVAFRSLATNVSVFSPLKNPQWNILWRDRDADRNGILDEVAPAGFTTTRVASQMAPYLESDGPSHSPAISADGSRVAFSSRARNLVPYDDNGSTDIFLWNVNRIRRMSLDSAEQQGEHGPCWAPSLAADLEIVAFISAKNNLFPHASTNAFRQVVVRDLEHPSAVERITTTDLTLRQGRLLSADPLSEVTGIDRKVLRMERSYQSPDLHRLTVDATLVVDSSAPLNGVRLMIQHGTNVGSLSSSNLLDPGGTLSLWNHLSQQYELVPTFEAPTGRWSFFFTDLDLKKHLDPSTGEIYLRLELTAQDSSASRYFITEIAWIGGLVQTD
jgi:hypothetical protein